MEIINKKHKEIFKNRNNGKRFIKFQSDKTIYISSKAVIDFELRAGLFLNFINDNDVWMFYADENKDGFQLFDRFDGLGKNMYIFSNPLISLFMKRTRCSLPCSFLLTKLDSKVNDCPLIKIEINKPLE